MQATNCKTHCQTNFSLCVVACVKANVIFSSCTDDCVCSAATAVLVIASTDVDKTGASYYGEQTLHYIATNGESAIVQLREWLSGVSHCTAALSSGNCCFTSFY